MIDRRNEKQKISIVISGWPAVGKTTIAAELAKEFRLEIYNGGDILKMLAGEKGYITSGKDWWDSDDAKKFMIERKSNPCFDKEVDRRLLEIANKGNVVITSYTLPWLVKDSIKFWLKGSNSSRAKRMAHRDNIRLEDAKNIIKSRDEDNINIYHKIYGINFGQDLDVFDFALNTDLISLKGLIVIAKDIVRNLIL